MDSEVKMQIEALVEEGLTIPDEENVKAKEKEPLSKTDNHRSGYHLV